MAISESRKVYIQRRLTLYLEAEERILNSQSYRIGSQSVTQADLAAVQSEIRQLENILDNGGGGSRTFRFVPRDL
jgi:hypothetical protein